GQVLLPKSWKNNYQNGEFFRGKIVLIGPTADIFQDAHQTPFPDIDEGRLHHPSIMLGPEIHLNIIGAALHREFLRDLLPAQNQMMILLFGLLALALCFFAHQPWWRLLAISLLCVAYWYLGQFLFNRAGLVIPMANPLLVLTISGVFVLGYDYFLEQFERARVRKTLERYVSKDIVKELLDNPGTYFNSLEGVRKPVTVLFSDVRGFTTLTENSDSAQLVLQLNEYFKEMVRHVFGFKGTLDKFIGDAVMAVWGNIVTQGPERDAQHAVATALAMKQSLATLNEDWKKRGMLELAFGIGINHGEAIVGNLGSTEKMELTVIGDAVNTASRLEGLTKRYHLDLLIGETVAPLVRERFILRTVDYVQVKGKTKPIEVFTVMGERSAVMDAEETAWLADYEEGVRLYRQRAFGEALRRFEYCLRRKPADYLSGMYCLQSETLLKNPPDASWNGVCVMTEK
ncbi:MAG TPA: adenylate/guanylate cyclase domain-containing protein, partial [Verrucomicrobiae bacterium]|nr:adenylate/guanylate cyclase domain-containing protein [Verrucomicrobiae bacterium]